MSPTSPDVTASTTPHPIAAPDRTPEAGSVVLFTTSWCGFCRRLRSQLDREGVPFTEIDIEASPEHVDFVEGVNDGDRTVPTVLFPDGSAATNPSLAEVLARLGA
jgi:mycoredoxin